MKSHSLFKLTAKLDEKEIAFVRTYINEHTKNKSKDAYLELFDVALTAESFEDDDVLLNLKSSYLQNHYSAARHYLYNLVFKAVCLFYSTYKVTQSSLPYLNNMDKLSAIFILIDKELYEEGYKLCKKYITAWELEENFSALVMAYKFLDRIELLSGKKMKGFENMRLSAEYAQKQALEYKYNYLAKEIAVKINDIGIARNDEEVAVFKAYLNSADFDTDLPNEKYYWNAKSKCHNALLEFEEAYTCNQNLQILINKKTGDNPNHLNITINVWLALMNSALGTENLVNYQHSKTGYLKCIEAYQPLPQANEKIFSLIFNSVQLKHFYLVNNTKAIVELSENYFNEVSLVNKMIYDNLLIESYFIIGKTFFNKGDYETALDWFQNALDKKNEFSGSAFIINFCFIYLWFTRYQLNDFEMLISITDTAYRYMRKNKAVYPLEKNFLSFFRSAQHQVISSKLEKHVHKLQEKNESLLDKKYNRYLLKYLDINNYLNNILISSK